MLSSIYLSFSLRVKPKVPVEEGMCLLPTFLRKNQRKGEK
jgi:hypothetical protein